ncbi:Armadillo-like helical [Artemisia annua]|uniref:Armadillo-like helical n=1 Tax=Artemisia annua TaxID=35608 RepID=A0A2U1NT54_ARTAN|nr:Armadillo-like helical [Artemisia annua]
MGKKLSPVLRRELENLDKESATRRSVKKALKSYVNDLDSKAISIFLAQVSETKETGLTSGEYTISLYEVLARVHGTKIVPQIDNIMTTIIKTLTSSAGSFALHQACSKVVRAYAKYYL